MELPRLAFPPAKVNVRQLGDAVQIWDSVRQRYVALTPEEWVRQNLIAYLTDNLGYPKSLLTTEQGIKVALLAKRCDLLLYTSSGEVLLLIECKRPTVQLTQATLNQALRYNLTLQASWIILTNGLNHVVLKRVTQDEHPTYNQQSQIPTYQELDTSAS